MDINQSALSGYQPNNKSRRIGTSSGPASETSRTKDVSASSATDTGKSTELREGQTVKAQVIDIRYNEVKVQLEPGKQVVTARLAGDIPLSIGQDAEFVVTEKSAEHLVLKHLPEQSANPNEATIQKALSASGFPITDRNRELVSALLDNRMPIDKQTLQTMIKFSVKNREASPLTLVLMFKNKLPMTSANIKQFEAYQSGTHQLLNDIQKISQSITEILRQETGSSTATPLQNAIMINRGLIDILFGGSEAMAEASSASANGSLQAALNTLQSSQDTLHPIQGTLQTPQDTLHPMQSTLQTSVDTLWTLPGNGISQEQLLLNQTINLAGSQTLTGAPEEFLQQQLVSGLTDDTVTITTLESILSPEERMKLADTLAGLPQGQLIKERILDGTIELKEALTYVRENLSSLDTSSAGTLFKSPEYSKLLQEAFLHKWTITPDKTALKSPVADLYRQLKEDLERINTLIQTDKSSTEATKMEAPMKNLQDNLKFMKDLNEVFTYLQLPVQFKDQTTHTDLYVMTRKKALSDKKENLSVLLHLDMSHLGSLNVHIRMNPGSHIQADFYIDNKEAAVLIQENLPSLTTALEKKGYQLNSEVKDTYQKPDFSKDFIEQSSQDNSIRRYSFDIRT